MSALRGQTICDLERWQARRNYQPAIQSSTGKELANPDCAAAWKATQLRFKGISQLPSLFINPRLHLPATIPTRPLYSEL
jgi:hypothetical protein